MAHELYAVDPNKVERTVFTLHELAKTIADSVKTKRAMTLATDHRWYADAIITPSFAHITNLSVCYDGDFTDEELIAALREEGVYPNLWLGQSCFYAVCKEPEDNFCMPYCLI